MRFFHSRIFHSQSVQFFISPLKIKVTDMINNRTFASNLRIFTENIYKNTYSCMGMAIMKKQGKCTTP